MKRSTVSLALLAVLVMGSQAVCQKPSTPYELLKATLPEATKMLDANPKLVDAKDGNGDTALIHSSREGNEGFVKLLLSKGADPNVHGEYGRTALHTAAWNGNTKIIKLLLTNKASINATDDSGLTPLHFSAVEKNIPATMLLISKGANVTIIEATAMGDTERVESMLKANRKLALVKTKSGMNPLYLAARTNNFPLTKLLVACGADVNTKCTVQGWCIDGLESDVTPLHAAADEGNPAITEFLLAKGADPNIASGRYEAGGFTPLHVAVERDNMPIVKLLLSKKANVNAIAYNEFLPSTPLLIAIENHNVAMAELLLSKGAEPNIKSDEVNLLQSATEIGNKQMIALLKKYGAKL